METDAQGIRRTRLRGRENMLLAQWFLADALHRAPPPSRATVCTHL